MLRSTPEGGLALTFGRSDLGSLAGLGRKQASACYQQKNSAGQHISQTNEPSDDNATHVYEAEGFYGSLISLRSQGAINPKHPKIS